MEAHVSLEIEKLKQRVAAVEAHNGLTDPTGPESSPAPDKKKAGKKK